MSEPVAGPPSPGSPTPPASGSTPGSPSGPTRPAPSVPDHELLRLIGHGAYGEVWLARTVVGTLRAVKVVYRQDFGEPQPFDREFTGIQKFEPVSRSHDGLIDILQIGRNDAEGYFYYVMELADGVVGVDVRRLQSPTGRPEPPDVGSYLPHTLRNDLKTRGRLRTSACKSAFR
jgi:eukaryotic-like serine/threonine-protein kinase